MSALGFEYDSSYSDTAPYEPQPGGCCTWLPLRNGEIIELPITVPQDHTVFNLLGHEDASLWLEKLEFLKGQGGLALLLTHPDYMLAGAGPKAYSDVLDAFGGDPRAWKPLPRDVSSWWRRRGESCLERASEGWRVVGPAAHEAVVELHRPLPQAG